MKTENIDSFTSELTLEPQEFQTFHNEARIGIKAQKSLIFISVFEILFIEKIGREARIYLKNDEYIDTYENLKILEKKLRSYGFYRCHKSYIIPLNAIRSINQDDFMNSYNIVLIHSNAQIKLSKHKYKELRDILVTECKVEL